MFKEEFVFDLQRFVTINNEEGNTLLSGTSDNDTIQNGGYWDGNWHYGYSYVSIDAGAGNDSVSNWGKNVTIDGGDGKDTIDNYGNSVTINAGAGNDSVRTTSNNIIIDMSAGNDTIHSNGNSVSINAGSGDDYISNNYGKWATIDAGKGNDLISLHSYTDNNVIIYNNGDGFDTVFGFDDNDTLKISGGTYFSQVSGSDIIVTVDDGGITLLGAASLESVNIEGKYLNPFLITLTEGNDSYFNSVAGATIKALGGDDSIENYGENVTINAGAGSDYIDNYGSNSTLNGGAGNDSISNTGAKILFQYASGDGNDLIQGFNATSTLQITGGTYSTDFVGDDLIVTVGKGKITLVGAASLESVNINDEKIFSYSWTLDGTVATYGSANKTLATVSGVKSLNGISLDGKVVTVSKAALNATDISVSGGYTLALASDVPAPTTAKATYSNGVYKTAGISKAGYQLSGNSIRYVTADIKKIKFSGVDDDATVKNFYVSGTSITVGKAAVKTNGTALKLLTSGYTLKLGKGMAAPSTTKTWTLKNSAATYKQTTSAGYTLADNAITYSKKSSKTLVTVDGVKSLDGLKLSKKIVTVSTASLGTKDVSISDGYTLALGKDVDAPSTSKDWSLDGTTAAYQQTTTAGYTLADNAIAYSKKSSKTLVMVDGVKSLDGLKLSKKIVTVSSASLGTKNVSISDGYTLKLGSNVSKPSTSKDWSLDGITAAYQQTTTAGYKLADNSITYTKKSSKTLVTVDGVKSLDGLALSKKVVTVSAASLGTNDVTISNGYSLKLGSDVDAPTSKQAAWTLKNTTAIYKSAGTTAGYTLEDNIIRYSKKKSAATLATIKGVENVDGLSISGKIISAEATALASKVTVSSDEYGFNFGTDYKKARVSGSEFDDKIKSTGQRMTILGGAGDDSIVGNGKYSLLEGGEGSDTIISNVNGSTLSGGAGNDLLTGSDDEDTFVYAGGNDTITNYDTSDKISLASGAAKISENLSDIIFKFDSGKLTLKNAADLKVTYIDADGTEHTYPEEQNPVEFNAKGTGVTLTTAYTEDAFDINGYRDYKDSVITINASAVLHPLDITGNKNANKIIGTAEDDYIDGGVSGDTISGGAGNDTLVGSAGNDSLSGGAGNDSLWGGDGDDTLTGGAGEDTFIYYDGDGKDVIENYQSGVDTVMIMSGTVSNPIVDGSNVYFSVGDGQITFEDAASKPIVLVNRSSKQVGQYIPK